MLNQHKDCVMKPKGQHESKSIILKADNISKSYFDADSEVKVLHNLDISIAAGEKIAIVGRSGSGKTTLLSNPRLSDRNVLPR